MTSILHRFPDAGEFGARIQRAELEYLVSSHAAATSLPRATSACRSRIDHNKRRQIMNIRKAAGGALCALLGLSIARPAVGGSP